LSIGASSSSQAVTTAQRPSNLLDTCTQQEGPKQGPPAPLRLTATLTPGVNDMSSRAKNASLCCLACRQEPAMSKAHHIRFIKPAAAAEEPQP
jgi:hypothetical protein